MSVSLPRWGGVGFLGRWALVLEGCRWQLLLLACMRIIVLPPSPAHTQVAAPTAARKARYAGELLADVAFIAMNRVGEMSHSRP